MTTVYVDTNVFLCPVLFSDAKATGCRNILEGIVAQKTRAITSVLTWDEFVYVVLRTLGREVACKEGKQLLRFPHLVFTEANASVLAKAQELMVAHSILPRDAIHAATALLGGVDEIVSDDADFDRIQGLRRRPVL